MLSRTLFGQVNIWGSRQWPEAYGAINWSAMPQRWPEGYGTGQAWGVALLPDDALVSLQRLLPAPWPAGYGHT